MGFGDWSYALVVSDVWPIGRLVPDDAWGGARDSLRRGWYRAPSICDPDPARAVTHSEASFWLAVWGVSIDALVTGPGKAAATAHWTPAQVAISFPIVGAVVFVLVLISTVPAMVLHRRMATAGRTAWRGVGIFYNIATWVEVLVFTWFATLSLIETLDALNIGKANYATASLFTAAVGALLMIMLGPKIWRAQALAARNLVENDSA
jgi:hypothetical protein